MLAGIKGSSSVRSSRRRRGAADPRQIYEARGRSPGSSHSTACNHWRLRLQLLALGDFDSDRWEDVAFAWDAKALQFNYVAR